MSADKAKGEWHTGTSQPRGRCKRAQDASKQRRAERKGEASGEATEREPLNDKLPSKVAIRPHIVRQLRCIEAVEGEVARGNMVVTVVIIEVNRPPSENREGQNGERDGRDEDRPQSCTRQAGDKCSKYTPDKMYCCSPSRCGISSTAKMTAKAAEYMRWWAQTAVVMDSPRTSPSVRADKYVLNRDAKAPNTSADKP
jgi:hypothetical protein